MAQMGAVAIRKQTGSLLKTQHRVYDNVSKTLVRSIIKTKKSA